MAIYQKNSKGTIKSNFVASCLTFRGSILTRHCNIKIKGVEKKNQGQKLKIELYGKSPPWL